MRLTASAVGLAYGALPVLDGVSLSVDAGEIVAIVGPSGCGKSTLLRILGGLERPDAGTVTLQGMPPEGCLNPVTYVFQDFALLPWRSVADNVGFALAHHGLPKARETRIVADVLARLGLTDFARSWPRQLSGGMKQRVGIARALAVRPAVLLMDEPLSALDAQTRALLMDDLRGLLRDAPFAGVYVTHSLEEATLLASRIVVMSRRPGRIRATLEIDAPLDERRAADPALMRLREELWQMMRDEARAADRMADAGV